MLLGTISMSYIIEFYKLNINLIYAYAIEFLIKTIPVYTSVFYKLMLT
jgi:hypothetical protein